MKNKNRVIAASALVMSLLTSCMNANTLDSSNNSIENSTTTVQTGTIQSEDTSVTSYTETSETLNTLETEQHVNPLGEYSIENPSEYAYNAWLILYPTGRGSSYTLGFDNPSITADLQSLVTEKTGSCDNSVTMSDVGYFQYLETIKNDWISASFNDGYNNGNFESIRFEAVRAVLSSQGLRFGIDEIPASFFQSRFPRFYYDFFVYDWPNKYLALDEQSIEGMDNLVHPQDTSNDIYKDWIIFTSCMTYNHYRANYMYKNPCGGTVIQQVRDSSTGMNVLVPTDEQAAQLQQDINSIPGCENIDIFTPETPEQFYAYYGYYPDELVNDVVYGNTQEGFQEYYNSLPEEEQNELYAPILFE